MIQPQSPRHMPIVEVGPMQGVLVCEMTPLTTLCLVPRSFESCVFQPSHDCSREDTGAHQALAVYFFQYHSVSTSHDLPEASDKLQHDVFTATKSELGVSLSEGSPVPWLQPEDPPGAQGLELSLNDHILE